AAVPAAGQGPAAEWRTLETARYRVHYPAPAAEWAAHVAARLEAIRDRVGELVEYEGEEVVDVLLQDPVAQANGSAWPFAGFPRMVLWATPPEAGSTLGEFADWSEILVGHEQVHLSHLLRPSRNPWRRALSRMLPVHPIALAAPRWATEGYATLLEGRLTGSGRPHGHLRAAVLRRWAVEGRLPSYGALSGSGDSYLGRTMPYLAGSAFLEWLEQREGREALPALWRRLTARRTRGFDEAFRGVFGDSPADLYRRFTAELTHAALEIEGRLGDDLRTGEPWLDLQWGTGQPEVSRDGEHLVLVLRDRERPPRLAVFALAEDTEAAARREEAERRLLARDPEDVPAVRRGPPPRAPLHTLELADSTVAPTPRWLADGSLLLSRTLPDPAGVLHADLFRWWPASGRVDRLTHGADLRAADPAADGAWAVAVQSRWGLTRLVRVSLADGEVTPLTAATVAVIHDAPRLAPDGGRVAFLRHRQGAWQAVVRDLASGEERVLPTPLGATLAHPAWDPAAERLFLVVGEGGLLDIHVLSVDGGERLPLTRSLGAALHPAPTPDGTALFFLALDADGLDVHRLALPAPPLPPLPPLGRELVPAVPPPPEPPPPLLLAPVPPSRPYGIGRGEWGLLDGGGTGPAGAWAELGVRGGDVIGRWNLLALAGGGDGSLTGGAVALGWRGWPVTLSLHAFTADEEPSAQPDAVPGLATALDQDHHGISLGADGWRHSAWGGWGAGAAAWWERTEPARQERLTRRAVALSAMVAADGGRGRWSWAGSLA
ncbi:MAG TPA: hypothetical protein VMT16_15025, partial [Thermoanaerobaculia bacterium]|nr:hypothetical protein [Thermoanaerobaculia bacterium]